MRVVVNTPAELVARHRPRLLPLMGAALVVAVAARAVLEFDSMSARDLVGTLLGVATGAVIVVLMARGSEFRFDAASRELRWRRTGLRARSHGALALEAIRSVEVEADRPGAGEPRRVVLLTQQGRIPLTWHYSGIEPHWQTAEAIRLWLRQHGVEVSGPGGESPA